MTATPPAPPTPPHEPEIEFLRKVARFALLAFRVATVTAGAVAIGFAGARIVDPPMVEEWGIIGITPGPIGKTLEPIAPYFVWLCIGIPPLLPTRWLFGRGRWLMLLVGVALWFGPSRLEGDSDYGYIIRFFASLVAVSVLLVWKTVFALTTPPPERPHP